MKCIDCNLKCCKSINYCPKTGEDLIENSSFILNKKDETICRYCDIKQNKMNIYCSDCGKLLYDVSQENIENLKDININKNKEYIKGKFIISTSAIVLLFLISAIVKLFIGFINIEMINNISIFNIILGLNLAPLEVITSASMELSKISLTMGIIIYLVAPIICLSLSIYIYMKKTKNKNINIIKDSLTIGLIYGLILGIISIFSKKILSSNIDVFYTISIIIKYKVLNVIFNGFIIGFIVSYINLARYSSDDSQKIGIKSFNSILTTYFIILLVLIISIYTNNILGYNKSLMSIVGLIQLAIYILAIANFVPIVILGELISITNISSIMNYLNEGIIILIYGAILLNFLILLISGYCIKNRFDNIKFIRKFSIYYSLIIGAILHISSINICGGINLLNISNYEGQISIGGNLFISIIISFVYSYIISFIGYKLNNK